MIPKAETNPWQGSGTTQQAEARQIVARGVLRQAVDVPTRGMRTPLGVETPRPWSDGAIQRPTSADAWDACRW